MSSVRHAWLAIDRQTSARASRVLTSKGASLTPSTCTAAGAASSFMSDFAREFGRKTDISCGCQGLQGTARLLRDSETVDETMQTVLIDTLTAGIVAVTAIDMLVELNATRRTRKERVCSSET